jgi:hypothetical protein
VRSEEESYELSPGLVELDSALGLVLLGGEFVYFTLPPLVELESGLVDPEDCSSAFFKSSESYTAGILLF